MTIFTINNSLDMQKLIDEVWSILYQGYSKVKGGLHFSSPDDLIKQSYCWKITTHGSTISSVTVFKKKRGLKLVAMAVNSKVKEIGKLSLISLIKRALSYCWMELSEAAEHFVMRYCGGDKFVHCASQASFLLGKDGLKFSNKDQFHYIRTIQNIEKEKIIVGTPQY